MRRILTAMIAGGIAIAAALPPIVASAQTATLPIKPSDNAIPPDVTYPDAVACDVTSPDGIVYRTIFYKSQTISFAHEPNNAAEYGTTFTRSSDKSDSSVSYRWRLQLGKPGNITAFTLPAGWSSANCPLGKAIADLVADKQALKIFAPQ